MPSSSAIGGGSSAKKVQGSKGKRKAKKKEEETRRKAEEEVQEENETEFQKALLEVRVNELETLNIGLTRKASYLETQNENYKAQLQDLRLAKEELVGFFERSWKEEKTAVKYLEEKICALIEASSLDTASNAKILLEKQSEFDTMKEHLEKHNQELGLQLAKLEDFRLERDELTKKLSKLEQTLETERKDHVSKYEELENEVIRYREKIKKEAIETLVDIAKDVQKAGKLCLNGAVKAAIAANVELKAAVETVSRDNLILRDRLDSTSVNLQQTKMKLSKLEKGKLLDRKKFLNLTHILQVTLENQSKLNEKCKSVSKVQEELDRLQNSHQQCKTDMDICELVRCRTAQLEDEIAKIKSTTKSSISTETEIKELRALIVKLAISMKKLTEAKNEEEFEFLCRQFKTMLSIIYETACGMHHLSPDMKSNLEIIAPTLRFRKESERQVQGVQVEGINKDSDDPLRSNAQVTQSELECNLPGSNESVTSLSLVMNDFHVENQQCSSSLVCHFSNHQSCSSRNTKMDCNCKAPDGCFVHMSQRNGISTATSCTSKTIDATAQPQPTTAQPSSSNQMNDSPMRIPRTQNVGDETQLMRPSVIRYLPNQSDSLPGTSTSIRSSANEVNGGPSASVKKSVGQNQPKNHNDLQQPRFVPLDLSMNKSMSLYTDMVQTTVPSPLMTPRAGTVRDGIPQMLPPRKNLLMRRVVESSAVTSTPLDPPLAPPISREVGRNAGNSKSDQSQISSGIAMAPVVAVTPTLLQIGPGALPNESSLPVPNLRAAPYPMPPKKNSRMRNAVIEKISAPQIAPTTVLGKQTSRKDTKQGSPSTAGEVGEPRVLSKFVDLFLRNSQTETPPPLQIDETPPSVPQTGPPRKNTRMRKQPACDIFHNRSSQSQNSTTSNQQVEVPSQLVQAAQLPPTPTTEPESVPPRTQLLEQMMKNLPGPSKRNQKLPKVTPPRKYTRKSKIVPLDTAHVQQNLPVPANPQSQHAPSVGESGTASNPIEIADEIETHRNFPNGNTRPFQSEMSPGFGLLRPQIVTTSLVRPQQPFFNGILPTLQPPTCNCTRIPMNSPFHIQSCLGNEANSVASSCSSRQYISRTGGGSVTVGPGWPNHLQHLPDRYTSTQPQVPFHFDNYRTVMGAGASASLVRPGTSNEHHHCGRNELHNENARRLGLADNRGMQQSLSKPSDQVAVAVTCSHHFLPDPVTTTTSSQPFSQQVTLCSSNKTLVHNGVSTEMNQTNESRQSCATSTASVPSPLSSRPRSPYNPRVEPISPSSNDVAEALSKVEREIKQKIAQMDHLNEKVKHLEKNISTIELENSQYDVINAVASVSAIDAHHRSIYAENQAKATASHKVFDAAGVQLYDLGLGNALKLPLYKEPSDTLVYHANIRKFQTFKATLQTYLRIKAKKRAEFDESFTEAQVAWSEELDRFKAFKLRQDSHDPLVAVKRLVFAEMFPFELSSTQFGYKMIWADLDFDDTETDSRAIIPPLNDSSTRQWQFKNRNGLIREPLQDLKKSQGMINSWTEEEKTIFERQYLQFPKAFATIKNSLSNKTVANCVHYYYLTKRNADFEEVRKKLKSTKPKTKPIRPKSSRL